MPSDGNCPNCLSGRTSIILELQQVPVNSVVVLPTREEARSFPRGDIVLAYCSECGFITNLAFDASLLEYSPRYESTQAHSATFNQFHRHLAQRIIDRFDLCSKTVVEIWLWPRGILALAL